MNKKKIIRLELVLLALVTILLAYRALEGPPAPDGIVVHTGLQSDQVQHHAFSIDSPVRVAIDAVGSFEADDERSTLAAYGWILHRESRDVVWRMDPAAITPGRGTLAALVDTIDLGPGTYDVYFTSYGSERSSSFGGIDILERLFRGGSKWKEDEDEWKMIVQRADEQEIAINRLHGQSAEQLSPSGAGLFWSTAPMSGHEEEEFVFNVSEPANILVYAIGEIDDQQMDFGWIEDAVSGRRIWEMALENTEPAGGWEANRLFRDTLQFTPGIYRVIYSTDARQSYDDWVGNPPYDPAGWGISLFSENLAAVAELDLWSDREPILSMTGVGDAERRSAQLHVRQPLQVVAYAVGEMSDDSRYDYGWIMNNETKEMVWEMTHARSRPAGGQNNRVEMSFLQLAPATYTATYVTDDSHSFESWGHGTPENPERWGLTIFPLTAEFDSTAVSVTGYKQESGEDWDASVPGEVPVPPGHLAVIPLPPQPGVQLVDLTRVGNEKELMATFEIADPAPVHVRAVGEVSLSGRYDYGWIENADTGEIVWEMSWQNTHPAGGGDRNRMFDGPVTLSPGRYGVHFKSDFSHSFGDFGDESPMFPEGWGIRVTKP
ncbi:MAG: hypothetical protein WD275_03875 [Rhodothermales bacterium]